MKRGAVGERVLGKFSWLNAVDGDFADGANWTNGQVPGRTDRATLGADGGAPYTVTSSLNENVKGLTIASGDILSIIGGRFAIRDGVSFAGGGTITVSDGAVLTLKGDSVDPGQEFSFIKIDAVSKVRLVSANLKGFILLEDASGLEESGQIIVKGTTTIFEGSLYGTTHIRAGADLEGDPVINNIVDMAENGGARITFTDLSLTGPNAVVNIHAGDSIVGVLGQESDIGSFGTISGAGQIGFGQTASGHVRLINYSGGVIDAHGPGALTINTRGEAVINMGTIEATGRGRCVVKSAVGGAASGVLMAAGGSLDIKGAVVGTQSGVIDGGTLAFGSTFTGNVAFTGASGVLKLGQSQGYTGNVTGFSRTGGTSLDLRDIGFVGAGQATFAGTSSVGTLTVTDGTHTAHITLVGDFRQTAFVASDDGHGGVGIIDTSAARPAPPHRFIAAMAALAPSGGGADKALHGGPARQPMVFKPHGAIA
jgi:hypothetical protein